MSRQSRRRDDFSHGPGKRVCLATNQEHVWARIWLSSFAEASTVMAYYSVALGCREPVGVFFEQAATFSGFRRSNCF